MCICYRHVHVPVGVLPIEPFCLCSTLPIREMRQQPPSAQAHIAQGARRQEKRLTGAPDWEWVLRGAVGRPFLAPAFPKPA